MKRFATTVALMCALSTSIFAGEMPTTGKSDPAPTPSTSTSTSTASTFLSVVLTLIALR